MDRCVSAAYRHGMQQPQVCALCGDPIEPDQARLTSGSGERVAHAGCVYRDEPTSSHEERWEPAETPSR